MSLLQRAISISPAGADCERKEGKKNPFLIRICSFLLPLVICMNLVPPAHAYSIVHIQASIDLATWEILTGVVRDEVGVTACSPEWKRMSESDLTSLSSYSYNSLDLIDAGKVASRDKELAHNGNVLAGVAQNAGFFEEDNRVLSFPTKQESRNSSDSTDMESAMNANNAIVFDLNQAFSVYCERNGITKTADATAMLAAITSFMGDTSPSGDYIEYYASATGNEKVKYRWKVEKYQNSSEMITWSMLIVEAFNNFSLEGDEAVDADNVFSSNPNQLTKAIVGFFSNTLDGLRSILGLWSMDELMFNEGWRSSGYVGGIFPTSWEPTIWALFIFTEIIAAMILLVGIVMNVLKQAASTMNTIARIHAMTQIQDLLVCGIALVLLPVALRMVIAMSGNLVEIVSAMRPDSLTTGEPKTISELVARFSSSNGSFGGIIAQCLFFGAQVYFNFFYALRALTTAILIIMAPMMVAMITVSSSRKQTTMTWAKELLANILVQPIHTFCITVILILPTSTHGFDNLIALYAIIPFTTMIRSLFFGPAGGFVDQVAGKGAAVTNGAIAGAAMGAASRAGGGLLSFAKDKLGGGGGSSEGSGSSENGNSSEGGAGGAGGTNTNLSNASAERNSANGQNDPAAGAAGGAAAGGAAGGAASGGGAADGSGEPSGAGAASPIADAQNGSASPAGQGQSGAGGNAQQKPTMKDRWNNFQNSDMGRLTSIAGGTILGGIGGAFTGAGLHGIGAPISSAADSLVASRGQQKQKADEEEQKRQDQGNAENGQNPGGNDNGADANLVGDPNLPLTMESIGKRKANDSSGDQPMQVRDLDQKELDKQGFSDIEDSRKTMEFTAKGNSAQAKELGAYADYLDGLTPEQRKREVNDRGIEATRVGDDVQVRIDKDKWSRSNGGAEISARENKKTGDMKMTIKSPDGGPAPSFTGAAKFSGVHPVDVPKATQSGVTTLKNGQELSRPQDVEQKMNDHGITGAAAARTADRVGAMRELRAQGYSPSEAARLSKKMVSGVQARRAELSIPKAELSSEQTATMIRAVQSGEASGTPSMYRAEYEPGTQAPSFGSENSSEATSFSGLINQNQATAAPVEVSQAASVDTGGSSVDAESTPSESSSAAAYGAVDASYVPISDSSASPPAPASAPVETPAQETTSMPASTTETNNVSSVPMSATPTSSINPDLAARYAVYQTAKQETGSASAAYAASHRNIGTPAPAPVRTQPSSNAGAGMANVNMGRANTSPPQQPPVSPNPAPPVVRNAPAPPPAPPVNQGRPAPAPVSSPAPVPRSWAPGSRPANPHREVRTATQPDSSPVSEPIQVNAPPPPPQASNYDIPVEATDPRQDDIMTQADLDALSDELIGGDPFDDPFDE